MAQSLRTNVRFSPSEGLYQVAKRGCTISSLDRASPFSLTRFGDEARASRYSPVRRPDDVALTHALVWAAKGKAAGLVMTDGFAV
jgi:hypothetical protein